MNVVAFEATRCTLLLFLLDHIAQFSFTAHSLNSCSLRTGDAMWREGKQWKHAPGFNMAGSGMSGQVGVCVSVCEFSVPHSNPQCCMHSQIECSVTQGKRHQSTYGANKTLTHITATSLELRHLEDQTGKEKREQTSGEVQMI